MLRQVILFLLITNDIAGSYYQALSSFINQGSRFNFLSAFEFTFKSLCNAIIPILRELVLLNSLCNFNLVHLYQTAEVKTGKVDLV